MGQKFLTYSGMSFDILIRRGGRSPPIVVAPMVFSSDETLSGAETAPLPVARPYRITISMDFADAIGRFPTVSDCSQYIRVICPIRVRF